MIETRIDPPASLVSFVIVDVSDTSFFLERLPQNKTSQTRCRDAAIGYDIHRRRGWRGETALCAAASSNHSTIQSTIQSTIPRGQPPGEEQEEPRCRVEPESGPSGDIVWHACPHRSPPRSRIARGG